MNERTARRADGVAIGAFFTLVVGFVSWIGYNIHTEIVCQRVGRKACEDTGHPAWHVEETDKHRIRAFCATDEHGVARVVEVDIP